MSKSLDEFVLSTGAGIEFIFSPHALSTILLILLIDGVKVFFEDGSALVRASNTGPHLTVRFEAKTRSRLDDIEKEFMDKIRGYILELS